MDATQPASFIEELDDQGEPTGSILGWKDWRAGRTLYYTNDAAVVEKARVAPASMNGLASVDFGTAISDTAPAFILRDASGAAVPKFATVFVVWESITGSADAVPHPLGGNGWSFLRSSKSNLAGTFYDVGAHAEIQGAGGTVACTTVDAPVTLEEGFAVRLRAASGTRLARGSYPLLKAEALSGGARCGLVDPQGCCRAGRCRRAADALWLDVVPCGSVVIFR